MLQGNVIRLRTVRETDLEALYKFHLDLPSRGAYFPIGVMAEPVFKARFGETGFWQEKEGMLLIVNENDEIMGHIEFFHTVSYLDEIELSYQIYNSKYQGRGVATDAVKLMTSYLFDRAKINRIRLIIHPENIASKRVAEKCGYKSEGVARGAWYHRGRNHDVEVYALLRQEHYNSKQTT